VNDQHLRRAGSADITAVPGIAMGLDDLIRTSDDGLDSTGIGVLVRARDDLDGTDRPRRTENLPATGRRAIEALSVIEYLGLEGTSS
jgi:hypothetical protein